MLKAIKTCPIPTIAAFNVPAAHTRANMALAADIILGAGCT